jgi:hypothetical protein
MGPAGSLIRLELEVNASAAGMRVNLRGWGNETGASEIPRREAGLDQTPPRQPRRSTRCIFVTVLPKARKSKGGSPILRIQWSSPGLGEGDLRQRQAGAFAAITFSDVGGQSSGVSESADGQDQ